MARTGYAITFRATDKASATIKKIDQALGHVPGTACKLTRQGAKDFEPLQRRLKKFRRPLVQMRHGLVEAFRRHRAGRGGRRHPVRG
ncbi:MAG: hypothetical protein ACREE4_23290, partial [Stellaceae bacterium]